MSSPVRLLALSAYTDLGGGETSLVGLMAALDRTRVTPALLTRRDGPLSAAVRALGLDVHILLYEGASAWFVPSLWARLPATRQLAQRLGDIAPDVVYTDFHTLPFAAPACRAAGIPLIFICWGWWFRPKPWQRRFYREHVDVILAASHAIKRGFLGSPPFMAADRIRIAYPGVDPSVFRPRPSDADSARRALGLGTGTPLVALVARFQDVKGHDVFLDAAKRIAAARPDAQFAIAGEDLFGVAADAAFKERIVSSVARDAVLRARLRFLGWIAEPQHLLAASDVVVCSSRFESFGMVAVEAMSCGVPIVSTNVGGPAETIDDGVTGCLVPPGRSDLIAERVLTLLSDDRRRLEMGAAGRERAVRHFSIQASARAFEDVVEAVTAGRRARAR